MPTKHKHILYICQDQQLQQQLVCIFQNDYRPLCASNEEIALEILDKYKDYIVGIILDDSISEERVVRFLEIYSDKQSYDQIPIFLCADNDELCMKGISWGVQEIIKKPFNQEVFRQKIIQLISVFKHKHRLKWLVNTQTKELQESLKALNEMRIQVLESLGTLVEFRNLDSGEHIFRVRYATEMLMNELKKEFPEYGINDDMVKEIALASILHDVGKIAISDNILNKPGKLTDSEFEEIKKHTLYGCEILKQFKGLYNDYTYHFYYDIIRYHHEKWDGRGYPDGLKGEEIPIWAQIVSVADVYDALTNERVYKPSYTHEQAIAMIFHGACGEFNPKVLQCLNNVKDKLKIQSEEIKDIKIDEELEDINRNSVLSDLEKEKAYHRAYVELINDSFFEFDSQYHMINHYNMLGRLENEHYKKDVYENIHPDDKKIFKDALASATIDNPTTRVKVRIKNEFNHSSYQLYYIVIRTIWDMYTKKRIGGVGKIELVHE